MRQDDDISKIKPNFYLTRDESGLFLWFSLYPPVKIGTRQIFTNKLCGWRMRLPESWYSLLIDVGECRKYRPEIVLSPTRRTDLNFSEEEYNGSSKTNLHRQRRRDDHLPEIHHPVLRPPRQMAQDNRVQFALRVQRT